MRQQEAAERLQQRELQDDFDFGINLSALDDSTNFQSQLDLFAVVGGGTEI